MAIWVCNIDSFNPYSILHPLQKQMFLFDWFMRELLGKKTYISDIHAIVNYSFLE